METEFAFTLPRGYLHSGDGAGGGELFRDGRMRLARAGDEILPLEDPRVRGNRAYLVILLLARVVVRLGPLEGDAVSPDVIENLFAADLAYLQRFYREINGLDGDVECPHCGKAVALAGETAVAETEGS